MISSRILSVTVHGWITFPLTKTVRRWFRKRANNKGIRIRIKGLYGTDKSVKFASKHHFRREPMLVVFTKRIKGSSLASLLDDTSIMSGINSVNSLDMTQNEKKRRRTRQKRHTPTNSISTNSILERKKEEEPVKKIPCQLRPLFVDTDKFGVRNRFLTAEYININQCTGSCVFDKDVKYAQTNHGLFQAFAALHGAGGRLEGKEAKPNAPCCAPSAFEDKTLIASLQEGSTRIIKVLTLDKLVATKCACL